MEDAELGAGEVEGLEEVLLVEHVAEVCPSSCGVNFGDPIGVGEDDAGEDEARARGNGKAQTG